MEEEMNFNKLFAKYIMAQLRRYNLVTNIFHTERPTEKAIQEKMDKKKVDSNSIVISAKAMYKLLRDQTEDPTEKTLNYTADFFGLDIRSLDDFSRAWRKNEVTEKDLIIPGIIPDIEKLNHTEILRSIISYRTITNSLTANFVGRRFIYDRLDVFIKNHSCGYFILKGSPGIGKTSVAIKLVKDRYYSLHVINALNNGNTNEISSFTKNICAQLIVKYQLPKEDFPEGFDQNGDFLLEVLEMVSDRLTQDEKAIIVIDGIDELDNLTFFKRKNILFLPDFLPSNIYFILTMRDIEDQIGMPKEENTERYTIKRDSKENTADIKKYILNGLKEKGVQNYLIKHNIEQATFIKTIEEKCEGNFIYLKYVLYEISQGNYQDLTLNLIPKGLEAYYRDHWERMKGKDEHAWFEYKLPIIKALALVHNPRSIALIATISGIKDLSRVGSVIKEWKQFLVEEPEEDEMSNQEKYYKFYHKSFVDFLKQQDEVPSEQVFIKQTQQDMNARILKDVLGEAWYEKMVHRGSGKD